MDNIELSHHAVFHGFSKLCKFDWVSNLVLFWSRRVIILELLICHLLEVWWWWWWCLEVGAGGWWVSGNGRERERERERLQHSSGLAGSHWSAYLERADWAEEPRQAAQLGMNWSLLFNTFWEALSCSVTSLRVVLSPALTLVCTDFPDFWRLR